MIKSITKLEVYHVTLERDGDHGLTEFRTNRDGTVWECLMGGSWEYIQPRKRVLEEFRKKVKEL